LILAFYICIVFNWSKLDYVVKKMRFLWIGVLALAMNVCFANANDQARMTVHLLDYIAVDYAMAVDKGEVINLAEYEEMQEFANTIERITQEAPASVKSDVELLKKLVASKAGLDKVSSVANSIKQKVISTYNLKVAPKRFPSLENGAQLFNLHCASCHGANGKGNGILAASLDPAPTNFHQADKANGLSPFQAYNTIRLGVEGTGMRAFDELSDDEVWDLAFYAISLPQRSIPLPELPEKEGLPKAISLDDLASKDNTELTASYQLNQEQAGFVIPALRLYPKETAERSQGDYLDKAILLLEKSNRAYADGQVDQARTLALTAYLEGVEPIEAKLRANSGSFASDLETQLATMRSLIEKGAPVSKVSASAQASIAMVQEAQSVIGSKTFSGWLAFLLSSSIILREGLEAFLVILTMLSIIRALKLPKAAKWVHGGWVAAIASGVLMWLAAGKLFSFSGAQRELMEGLIALFAVGVLLYVGFWMHSKSEAGKWQAYVKNKIQGLAKKENMLGLAFLSFIVVFREAFESVLFLSALSLEVGEGQQMAFGGGVVFAFVALLAISVLLLKYSKKIPIPKLFKYSALVISFLAVVLVGKGVHALQEAGSLSISMLPASLKIEAIGLYPSWETLLSQLAVLALIVVLWNVGNSRVKAPARKPVEA
jgi:high-affinity iron transporter